MNTNYAKTAEGHGAKAYQVRSIEGLKKAIVDAKDQTQSTLIEIDVLPKMMIAGYDDSWWNVGVAEVSEKPAIQEAYQVKKEKLATAGKY